MHTAAMGRTQKQDDEQRIDQQDIFRLCRKVGFWRPNPKIGYQKINGLRVSTFLFSVICDRADQDRGLQQHDRAESVVE